MSSRFSANSGDGRFPRDRSPRPSHDRGQAFDRSDSYSSRSAGGRDPPRGPKAQIGRGAPFPPRGRGFAGRGDGRDRDFRDDAFARPRGRGQDWDPRDRFDARDRRQSPSRARSRSPSRDYRDLKDSRDHDLLPLRRDSRDRPSPPAGDSYASRGRGGYRVRGRGDWEHGPGRNYSPDDRGYEAREPFRDRRDDDLRRPGGDRDDRPRSDFAPFRPDSRNSYGASRSTSTASVIPVGQEREIKSRPRETQQDLIAEDERRMPMAQTQGERSNHERKNERLETRTGNDRSAGQPSSPVAPPSIPQFGGAILPDAALRDRITKVEPSKSLDAVVHPERRAMLGPANSPPPFPTAAVLNAPTAPKAQQRSSNQETRQALAIPPPQAPSRDAPSGPNWTKPLAGPIPQPTSASPRVAAAEQPSVRKALDEEGRNGNLSSPAEFRAAAGDTTHQASPIKIPTGPRANRGGPSIRQGMQPSIRGGAAARPASVTPGRGTSTWTWKAPPRGPSIMNKVPIKRGPEDEDALPRRPSSHSSLSAVEEWRKRNILPRSEDENAADEKQRRYDTDAEDEEMMQDIQVQDDAFHSARQFTGAAGLEDESEAENGMDLDDEDIDNAQQNYDREMRRLESRRPGVLAENDVILQLLDELDALAIAMKEYETRGDSNLETDILRNVGGLPSPKAEDDYSAMKREVTPDTLPRTKTPLVEDLPFLTRGPPTPFSDFEELKIDEDEDLAIRDLVLAKTNRDDLVEESEMNLARQTYCRLFKKWRKGLDDIDEELRRKEEDERGFGDASTPEIPSDPGATPQTARPRRMMSEYAMTAVMKESMETAAREERLRREQEERQAQVYVPVDTFNPDREAEIPAMLGLVEAQSVQFADVQDWVCNDDVLDALGYIPLKDRFTKEEHKEFQFHYVTCPKKFGEIASKMKTSRITYKECVRHYYASKRSANYKNLEAKFYKTGRGKRFVAAADRAAVSRSNKGLLPPNVDGAVDFEAQNAALTESGRPKRAAAPTFGETTDAESAAPPATTPARRAASTKEGAPSAEKPRQGKVRGPGTGARPGRKPGKPKDQPQPLLAAAPDPSQGITPMEGVVQNSRPYEPVPIADVASRPVADREAAQMLAELPSRGSQPYPGPTYTETWISGQPAPSVQEQEQQQFELRLQQREERQQQLRQIYEMQSQPPQTRTPPSSQSQIREQQQLQREQPQQEYTRIAKQEPMQLQSHQQQQQQPPQQQQSRPASTNPEATSYWSVPEKLDFRNYVAYFGTNWQAIAATMKTKTQQMIKNYYQRETVAKKGESGKELEEAALLANQRRAAGEDMGPIPKPTPIQKKRVYDTNAARETPRALAPSVDFIASGDNSPSMRPAKMQNSPLALSAIPTRLPVSSQLQAEQKAAIASAQMQAQGPQSPRNVMHAARGPQQAQGPHVSTFSEGKPRLASHQRPIVEAARRDELEQRQYRAPQQQQQQQSAAYREAEERQEILRQQTAMQQRQLHEERRRKRESISMQQPQVQQQQEQHLQRPQQQHMQPVQSYHEGRPLSRTEQTFGHEAEDYSRRYSDQRTGRDAAYDRSEDNLHPQHAYEGPKRHSHGQSVGNVAQSSAAYDRRPDSPGIVSSVPMAIVSREPPRPSSVPVHTSALAPPAPPKRSNISALLNDEPSEPKTAKRYSDGRAETTTPNPRSASVVHQHQPVRPPQQPPMFARSNTPSERMQPMSYNHTQHHRQDPGARQGHSGREYQTSTYSSSVDESVMHSSRAPVSQYSIEAPSHAQHSRGLNTSTLREPGPMSPQIPHSRTSSYSGSVISQQQQQQQQQHQNGPAHQDHRASIHQTSSTASMEPASHRLRGNPYANNGPPPPSSGSAGLSGGPPPPPTAQPTQPAQNVAHFPPPHQGYHSSHMQQQQQPMHSKDMIAETRRPINAYASPQQMPREQQYRYDLHHSQQQQPPPPSQRRHGYPDESQHMHHGQQQRPPPPSHSEDPTYRRPHSQVDYQPQFQDPQAYALHLQRVQAEAESQVMVERAERRRLHQQQQEAGQGAEDRDGRRR